MDSHYVLQLQQQRPIILKADEEAVGQLRNVPKVWSLEHDEALVQLMAQHIPRDNDALGAIKSFVEHVDVSSYCVSEKKRGGMDESSYANEDCDESSYIYIYANEDNELVDKSSYICANEDNELVDESSYANEHNENLVASSFINDEKEERCLGTIM